MLYHIKLDSDNEKTGRMPVSTSSANTCPDSCAQKVNKTCYAMLGPLGWHWKKVTNGSRGTNLQGFCATIAAMPEGQIWRHNQAGDLPGVNQEIDTVALDAIVRANKGRRGFTYTHKPMTAENAAAVKAANDAGFTVNLSADTLAQADALKALNVGPVTVVVPANVTANFTTPAGNKAVICPAAIRDDITCAKCKLCAWAGRQVIIAFPAHGSRAKHVKSDFVQIS